MRIIVGFSPGGEEHAEDYFCHVESPCDSLSACAVPSRVERNKTIIRAVPNLMKSKRRVKQKTGACRGNLRRRGLKLTANFFFVFASLTIQNDSVSAIINAFINLPTLRV